MRLADGCNCYGLIMPNATSTVSIWLPRWLTPKSSRDFTRHGWQQCAPEMALPAGCPWRWRTQPLRARMLSPTVLHAEGAAKNTPVLCRLRAIVLLRRFAS
jgi:hypothetical protein